MTRAKPKEIGQALARNCADADAKQHAENDPFFALRAAR
jgi:hypothetical protein